MPNRILKDIRFYESEIQNIEGNSIPQQLGKLFIPTKDTNFTGQRIARKLNELEYSYGEYDHIYINFTTFLKENEILISDRIIDKRIKFIDYGIDSIKVNLLSDIEKNKFIKTATFKILNELSDGKNLELVRQTEKQINDFETEIKILYKSKETNSYKIDIYYQIESIKNGTNAIIEYLDKKNNILRCGNFKLKLYVDIYTLIDKIILTKEDEIIMKPKTSYIAKIANERYTTPIKFKIDELEISCS